MPSTLVARVFLQKHLVVFPILDFVRGAFHIVLLLSTERLSYTHASEVICVLLFFLGQVKWAPWPTRASKAQKSMMLIVIHNVGDPLDPWPDPYNIFSGVDWKNTDDIPSAVLMWCFIPAIVSPCSSHALFGIRKCLLQSIPKVAIILSKHDYASRSMLAKFHLVMRESVYISIFVRATSFEVLRGRPPDCESSKRLCFSAVFTIRCAHIIFRFRL
jgi:hypothetical protein